MLLKASCQCGAVRFSVLSAHPSPYQRCYCGICRKQQGGGGYAINLSAVASTLKVTGDGNITRYHAHVRNPGKHERISGAERAFCKTCGTALLLFSSDYPDLIHPFASAIDTELPKPVATTHIMLASKPEWVQIQKGGNDLLFEGYPEESIAEWHDRNKQKKRP